MRHRRRVRTVQVAKLLAVFMEQLHHAEEELSVRERTWLRLCLTVSPLAFLNLGLGFAGACLCLFGGFFFGFLVRLLQESQVTSFCQSHFCTKNMTATVIEQSGNGEKP